MAHVFEKKWRSEDVRLQENVDFSALLLSERVLEGLQKAGFKKPSPIQLEAIPMGKFGKDLMVQAKSGTGKTLVFVVIALEMLRRKLFRPQILIIVPTREIAMQVCSVVKAVGSSFHKLTCNSFIGGLPLFEDQEKAVMTQIVVGTPGRLRQLIQLKSLPTNSIRLLIFDEADELLHSNSFKDDLEDIFNSLPDEKQIIATSATFSPKVKKVMYRYLSDPHFIRLNAKQLALLGMVHYAKVIQFCPMPVILYRAKLAALERILKTVKFAQCLMFCNGVQRVEVLYKDVKRWGFSVAYISSAKEQCDRLKAMERLKRFKCKVLVSSDLTSRGIDAENVDLVINFDLAYTTEIYMHRVGRAGRYGSIGVAISIIDDKELRYLQRIEKEGSFKAFKLPDPTPKDLILYPPEGEFAIDEPDSGNVDDDSEAKKSSKFNKAWNRFDDDDQDLEKEVNSENIEANGVSETNVDEDNARESEVADADHDNVEKEELGKEISVKNIQVKDVSEACNDVDNTIECASLDLAVDVKHYDDSTKHSEESERVDVEVISHSKNKNIKNEVIHLNEEVRDKKLQNGHANNDSIKQNKNMNSYGLNDCDKNEFTNGGSTDNPFACDIHENSDDFCDKNSFEKQDIINDNVEIDIQLIHHSSNMNGDLEKNYFETDDNKLRKIHSENTPESCELKDIVKDVNDDSANSEQKDVTRSCDILNNMIKSFFDTYPSNKTEESTKLEATFDRDSQLEENSGKKIITTDMIHQLKSQKHDFLYKTFKKFQESKDGRTASNKDKKKEDNEESNEVSSKTDLVNEEDNVVQEKLAENSEVENEEVVLEKPHFESTPALEDKIKQDIAKVTVEEADCKPVVQNKLTKLFQVFSEDETDSELKFNEEASEVFETSSIKSVSSSLSSDSEPSSLSSDSEDESSSEIESSSSGSSSDYSESSSSSEHENEDESVYHHNYSRTGRQNPSLVSGSVRGQVHSDRAYYHQYFQDCRCTSCGGRKKEILRDTSQVFGNPPYFFDHREVSSTPRNGFQTRSRREQNVADHTIPQSSLPRKHSRCHKSRHSPRNVTRERGDQCRNVCPSHRRSCMHRHTLDCFLPTGHRCHHDTPDIPCRQGPLCEMWYKTFYNQWLHIQSVIH